jgi:hypothetical protein
MSKLLIDEPALQVLPSLAVRIGLNEAIVLQQLHWALQRDTAEVRDGQRWLKAGLEFWCKQFPWWSEATIRRVFQNLRDAGLVESKRGRDAAWHTIHHDKVDAAQINVSAPDRQNDASTDHIDRSPCKKEGREVGERSSAATSAADDSEMTLPGLEPPPSPAKKRTLEERIPIGLVERVWDHWLEVFGSHHRIKTLTDARARMIRKALIAVDAENDPESAVNICHAATDGYQSFRMTKPKRIDPSDVFETGPNSISANLTEHIEFWASQARTTLPPRDATADGTHLIALDLTGVPSVTKGRIQSERRHVAKMVAYPSSSDAQERGHRAIDWLRETVGHAPVIEDGALRGWEQV